MAGLRTNWRWRFASITSGTAIAGLLAASVAAFGVPGVGGSEETPTAQPAFTLPDPQITPLATPVVPTPTAKAPASVTVVTPTPAVPTPAANDPRRNLPGGVLNLTNWKITLPTGPQDDASEVLQPKLNTFQVAPFFLVNPDKTGVIFEAPVGGSSTSGSGYPRSELREMAGGGGQEASWSNESGTHVMKITQAITATPVQKPHVVAGQIHDAEDDVVMVRLEGRRLFVEAGGEDVGQLDPAYVLGTKFTVVFTATSAGIRIDYTSGAKAAAVNYKKVGSGLYFKAGCYTQSNPEKGDKSDAFGQVIIYGLDVSHT